MHVIQVVICGHRYVGSTRARCQFCVCFWKRWELCVRHWFKAGKWCSSVEIEVLKLSQLYCVYLSNYHRLCVLHFAISIAWCDVTEVVSFKAIGICSFACYLGDTVCASAIGNLSFTFLSHVKT